MNNLKLKQEHIDLLSKLPESGMGYQIVDIKLNDGRKLERRIVLNSTFLQIEENEMMETENISEICLTR